MSRVRTLVLPLIGAGLLLAAVTGESRPSSLRASISSQGPVAVSTNANPPAAGAKLFCRATLPISWRDAFTRGEIPSSTAESLIPFAVAPDASRVFAADYTPSWSGVLAVAAGGRDRVRIAPFAHPATDQVGFGGFDGRYLVWVEDHSLYTFDDWSLHAWDSVTGRLINLARVQHQADGQPIPGPIVEPVVDRGMVAWTQSLPGPNRETQVHLFALATGKDTVVATGHLTTPVLAWPWLLWSKAAAFGGKAPAYVAVADARTGTPRAAPPVLASVRTPSMLAGIHGALAWVQADYRTMWIWNTADRFAQRIVQVGADDAIQFPVMTGKLIAWDGVSAAFVADLRSGALVQITPQTGFVLARGRGLLVSYPASTQAKSEHPRLTVSLVDAAELPALPSCAGSTGR